MVSKPIRVLVVDDHPVIRDALSEALAGTTDMELCGAAGSASEAFDLVKASNPDVAVVDISLTDSHGVDLVQNLKVQYPGLRIVVFSMYDENAYAERLLRAGALGYVMKNEPTQTVLTAIRNVAAGEYHLSKKILGRILGSLSGGRSRDTGFTLDELTDREMEVYQMIGQGYTVTDMADKLHLSRKTVETYRRRVKEKLGFDTLGELLQDAIQWMHDQSRI
jgi:DNA-binding NarL/FixJ family response regulator